MQDQILNSSNNHKAVLTSAIVAKSAVVRENGKVNIIVVFQKSTKHEFYWVFRAKNARSARKSWKFEGYYNRDFNSDAKPYRDFGSFVDYYSRRNQAKVLNVRVLHVRRVAALLTKTDFESIHSEWTPRINSDDPRSYKNQNRRLASHIKGRVIDWPTR